MYKLRIYKKDLEYSYALGVFPVLEALKHIPTSVDQLLISEKRVNDTDVINIIKQAKSLGITYQINEHKLKLLAPKDNTYCIAVYKKSQPPINQTSRHLVLVNPTNAGNMGMIIRTMIAFQMYDLVIIKPAVDVYDPKVITSSVGSLFQIRIIHYSSLQEYISANSRNKKREIYTFAIDKSSLSLNNIHFKDEAEQTYSLVFGNEANGLSINNSNLGKKVFIPQAQTVDSLNLSTAVAMVIWEAHRK